MIMHISDGSNFTDNIFKDVNPSQEDILIQELIVVMQEDRCVIHGWETKCRYASFSDVSAVCPCREDSGLNGKTMLVSGPLEGAEPWIIFGHWGKGLICEFLQELKLNSPTSLKQLCYHG